MNITKRLQEADPTLKRHNEGHWDEPYIEVPGTGTVAYSSFNDAGVEIEVGEFLYAMIRVLKPNHVLETGTHWGIGAAYMGQALKDNFSGHLDTIEFLPEIWAKANVRMGILQLKKHVTCHLMDVRAFDSKDKYQFIFLDTEPQTRFEELIKFYDSLEPGGFVFIHDLHRHMHQIPNKDHGFAWPYGVLPEKIKKLVKDGWLRPMHFPTPRGLTGFYKPHIDDYDF